MGWAGDTRWINRAAYDLMNYQPDATEAQSGMPRGSSLYGSLPEQLTDPTSFASRLSQILTVRTRHGISTSVQVDVPEVSNKAMLVMVHLLKSKHIQVTVLNFSNQFVAGGVRSEHLKPGSTVIDMFTDQVIAGVDNDHTFPITLKPHQGEGGADRSGRDVMTLPGYLLDAGQCPRELLRRRVACMSPPETRHASGRRWSTSRTRSRPTTTPAPPRLLPRVGRTALRVEERDPRGSTHPGIPFVTT